MIINPVSGSHDKKQILAMALSRFNQYKWEVTAQMTRLPGHATELAREAVKKGLDAVIAVGGDGTVNETATGLLNSEVTLGIIPCGSGNGLARHLGLSMHPAHAIESIIKSEITTIDAGEICGRPFFCTCGTGLDAQISFDFAQTQGRGFHNYLKCTLETFHRYHSKAYTLSIDGEKITEDALIIAVCNASQYGNNTYISPQASVTDGLLDITVVHNGDLLGLVRAGLDIMTGMTAHNPIFSRYRGRRIVIERDKEAPAHYDGEPVMLPAKLEINALPGALRVFCSHPDPHFLPLLSLGADKIKGKF